MNKLFTKCKGSGLSFLVGTAFTLVLLVSGVLGSLSAQSTSDAMQTSPTIEKLRSAVAEGKSDAEAEFWHHVQEVGTPLIETAPGKNILVTFLWKGDSETHNAVLVNTPIASSDLADAQLTRMPGTNVWYRTYVTRSDARFPYEISINDDMTPFDQVTDWQKRTSTFHRDPMNRREFKSTIFGGRELSYVEGPDAPPEMWINASQGAQKGRLEQTTLPSKLLGNTREIWIYTPPDFQSLRRSSEGMALLVVFDGGEYVSSIPVPTILDNLIAAKRIRPTLAVFVDNVEGKREDELNANPAFADFIAKEVVPWVTERYHITISPDRSVIAGSSSGGLAASFLAFRYPDLFGNVLSQSGAYFFAPPEQNEPEFLPHLMATASRNRTRFYLEVGALEMNRESFKGVNIVSSNRHFRDVLLAKGYSVTYREFNGGHSDLNWRSGFADGLLALVGTN